MLRVALQVLLALSLVMAVLYFWRPADIRTPDSATAERRGDLPKTYLYAIQRTSYDETGELSGIVRAIKAQDFPEQRETRFTLPRIYTHDGDARTWSASADNGKLKHGSQKLFLTENVQLINDQSTARLDTQSMTLDLKAKTAISRVPVAMTEGANRIDAQGMEADLITERVRLQPNVESIYVPISNQP
ncbi:hypothetical protein GCM10007053_02060 [Halioglobus pacificus]|uniref:Lipopolysaccharide export system protein LptC n=1 Tax=Parahalioglobus pacificus TaxID=930806 RepID=A0A919CHY5_9GAMM|nr:hypothetical protein GCM10007053_02060 [Halioglobus pacificus]